MLVTIEKLLKAQPARAYAAAAAAAQQPGVVGSSRGSAAAAAPSSVWPSRLPAIQVCAAARQSVSARYVLCARGYIGDSR
jgi:hypothetical protein